MSNLDRMHKCLLLAQYIRNLEFVIGKKSLVSVRLIQRSPLVKLGEGERKTIIT
jgi:hypothetical protein